MKEENGELNIVIPLATKKYPEIIFELKEGKISDKEKYDELCKKFIEMKMQRDKEIDDLKRRIIHLEKLLFGQKECEKNNEEHDEIDLNKGFAVEFSVVGREEFDKFFDSNGEYDSFLSFAFSFNENDIENVYNKLKKMDLSHGPGEIDIRKKNGKIFKEFHKKSSGKFFNLDDKGFFEYLLFFTDLKAIIKSDYVLKDLKDLKDKEKINKFILNLKLILKGSTFLKSQILGVLISIFYKNDTPSFIPTNIKDDVFNLLNDAMISFFNGNNSYQIKNTKLFSNFDDFSKTSLDSILFYFRDLIWRRTIEEIYEHCKVSDFNEIDIFIGSNRLKTSFRIKLMIEKCKELFEIYSNEEKSKKNIEGEELKELIEI